LAEDREIEWLAFPKPDDVRCVIGKILSGQVEDPVLQPNDVVVIKQSFF